jgi:hypothetical protein
MQTGVGIGVGAVFCRPPATATPKGFDLFMVRKADASGWEPLMVRKTDGTGFESFQVRTNG